LLIVIRAYPDGQHLHDSPTAKILASVPPNAKMMMGLRRSHLKKVLVHELATPVCCPVPIGKKKIRKLYFG